MKKHEIQQASNSERIVKWRHSLVNKTAMFLALFVSMASTSFAQTTDIYDGLTQTPQQQFENITQNLDLSEVTTGLLKDKGLQMILLNEFDGQQQLSDKNTSSPYNFFKLYAMLNSMAISQNNVLPHPNSYKSTIENFPTSQIPFGVIHYRYNEIKDEAISANLITSNGNQLFDVQNRTSSPYLEKEVFMSTPIRGKVRSLNNQFVLPSSLIFSNLNKTIASIKVDFGDGLGFRQVSQNQPIQVSYAAFGKKTITTKITYTDQSQVIAHSKLDLEVATSTFKGDFTETITGTPFTDEDDLTETGTAEISVTLACGHVSLVKPLIWVEGFNPPILGDFGDLSETHMGTVLGSGSFEGKTIYELCIEEGYDLVYVDFADGGDWIQKNGLVVREVIKWVNNRKKENGSTEQNIVIGESMGGLVAKYALRKMEVLGEDHETKTYMSLDSPHQGANIPLSAQFAAKQIPYIEIDGIFLFEYVLFVDFDDDDSPDFIDLRLGEKLLDTRAARQMILYQAPDNFSNQTGTDLISATHQTFYNQYHSLGDLDQCETYMSSNGSPNGTLGHQGFAPEELMLKIKFNNTSMDNFILANMELDAQTPEEIVGVGLRLMGVRALEVVGSVFVQGWVNFELNALPEYSATKKQIYSGHISAHILFVPMVWSDKEVKVKEVYPYDSSPGGTYQVALLETINLTEQPMLELAVDLGNVQVEHTNFNYIPVFSALDLPLSYKSNPYADASNLDLMNSLSSAKRVVLSDEVYPTITFFEEPDVLNNTLHTYFYNSSSDWFNLHLIGNDEINDGISWSSGSFNFGEGNFGGTSNYTNTDFKRTSSKIDRLYRISGTGKVYVNMNNRVGDIGTGLGAYTVLGTPSDPTNFIVSIKPICNVETKTLLVEAGGILHIGFNENNRGEVHVLEGAELRIGNGGSLYIKENSRLVIHRGAKLIIEDGGFVSNEGEIEVQGVYDPDLETWSSGELVYHDGADIKMENEFAEIDFNGGNLMIKSNATFNFRHDTGASGFLRFSKWGKHIFGEPNSRFQIKGDATTDVIVLIENGSDLLSNNVLDFIKIDKGRVVFRENARLSSVVPYYSNEATYHGLSENRGLEVFKYSHIINAIFDEVPISAPLFYGGIGSLNLYNSVVNNTTSETAIYVNGGSYKIGNTQINANYFNMIKSENLIRPALLFNSVLTSNHDNGAVTMGVFDYSNVQLSMTGNTLNGNYVGAQKLEGTLKLSCNDFNNYVYGGVFGYSNAKVRMNSLNRAGYNTFIPANNSALNVYLNGAREIVLHEGYNVFDESISPTLVSGSIRPFFPISSISGLNNNWNASIVPPALGFTNIVNELAPGMPVVPVDASIVGVGTCGEHYPAGGGIILTGGTATGNTSNPVPFSFGIVTINDAVELASSYMVEFNPNGNDLQAIDMFSEILMYNYQFSGNDLDVLLNEAQDYMAQAIRSAFDTQTITLNSSQNGFHPTVQQYVNTLNHRGQTNINSVNYYQQFEIEMKKAHLFHLLGNRDLALQILVNTETCGVLETEQLQINHWKKVFQEEKAKIQYGFEAESIDTNWVDTSGYIQPQPQQQFGNFGTLIQSPTSVLASSCNQNKSLNSGISNIREIMVYPNPTDDELFMVNNLNEGSTGKIVIHSLLGQHVLSLDCRFGENTTTIDVSSFSSGSYIYSYYVDGVLEDTGKLIIK